MDGLPGGQTETGVLQARKGQDSKQMLFILLSEACNAARGGKMPSSCSPIIFESGVREARGRGGGLTD